MIVYSEAEYPQGSVEWMRLRLGIPTASEFDRLVTPKTHKPSAARDGYRAELLAEWLLGQPEDWGSSDWMERGRAQEAEARRWYEFDRDVDVEQVGFVARDDGLVGGSPDGLVGDDGGLEIKVLSPKNHVLHLLGEEPGYVGQVQGLMHLTGRSWWDVLLYHHQLPKVVRRIERDEDYLAALVPVLDEFVERVEADKERLAEHRVERPWDPAIRAELARSEQEQADWRAGQGRIAV